MRTEAVPSLVVKGEKTLRLGRCRWLQRHLLLKVVLVVVVLLVLLDVPVAQGASLGALNKRAAGAQHKKVVRYGDQLFLVPVDNDSSDSSKGMQDHSGRRSARSVDSGGEVVHLGDQLFLVKRNVDKNFNHDDNDDNGGDKRGGRGEKHLHGIHKRAAIKDESYRWQDKTVPYLFDGSFSEEDKGVIRTAMEEWSRHTCVRFRPAIETDHNKVRFVNKDGCYSYVGMVDEGTQDISLAKDGCRLVSTALHEIGHALGMFHTQVRPDRDQHIKVDLSDVAKPLHDNFLKQTWQSSHHYGVSYDYKSIMHYDGTSFTSNGGTSIKTLDPKMQSVIGTAKHLSFGDIEIMNKMYHCAPKSCKLKDSDCPGVSFVDQTCKCVCQGSSSSNPVVPCSGSGGWSQEGDQWSQEGDQWGQEGDGQLGDGGNDQWEDEGDDDQWENLNDW